MNEIKIVFSKYCNADKLFLDNDQTVSIINFWERFSDAFPDVTYDKLIQADPDNKMGYKDFFDKCKADGVI